MSSADVANEERSRRGDRVLEVVVDLLETEGYDAVQLREVTRRAKMSPNTIYKRYANRDELILAALEVWMAENRYAGVAGRSHEPDESLYSAMMGLLRPIFEPWEQHPAMLQAYFRARAAPGGQRLINQGFNIVVPAGMEVLASVDEAFIADLDSIISSVVYGLVGRFAAGEIAVTDILPILDRTVYWLTTGYEARAQDRDGEQKKKKK